MTALSTGDDFPMLCETCLGGNPYVRMIKTPFGAKLCKITQQPYQGFRWKAGPQGRYKETIICFSIAKERNICQTCLNDMQFGLPVGVRDKLIAKNDAESRIALPHSNVGIMHYNNQLIQRGSDGSNFAAGMENLAATQQLTQFSQKMHAPTYNSATAFRNLPKLCSFWLNGTCNRVLKNNCPFRPCCGVFIFPELASTNRDIMNTLIEKLNALGPAAVQKNIDQATRTAFRESQKGNRDDAIKKRVYGEDDLSKKYLGRMNEAQTHLEPPSDTSITTLWVGNIAGDISAEDLRETFYAYGYILGIHIVAASRCAFVEYSSRAEAEYAAKQLFNVLVVKGHPLSLKWAKPKKQASESGASETYNGEILLPAPPGMESSTSFGIPGLPPATVPYYVQHVEQSPLVASNSSNNGQVNKRPRLSDSKPALPPPPLAVTSSNPVPQASNTTMQSVQSMFDQYGDNDD